MSTLPQVETEDEEWTEDFVGERDPSILHFLLASGDQISSKQLRDDLMTLLIAGHEVPFERRPACYVPLLNPAATRCPASSCGTT